MSEHPDANWVRRCLATLPDGAKVREIRLAPDHLEALALELGATELDGVPLRACDRLEQPRIEVDYTNPPGVRCWACATELEASYMAGGFAFCEGCGRIMRCEDGVVSSLPVDEYHLAPAGLGALFAHELAKRLPPIPGGRDETGFPLRNGQRSCHHDPAPPAPVARCTVGGSTPRPVGLQSETTMLEPGQRYRVNVDDWRSLLGRVVEVVGIDHERGSVCMRYLFGDTADERRLAERWAGLDPGALDRRHIPAGRLVTYPLDQVEEAVRRGVWVLIEPGSAIGVVHLPGCTSDPCTCGKVGGA